MITITRQPTCATAGLVLHMFVAVCNNTLNLRRHCNVCPLTVQDRFCIIRVVERVASNAIRWGKSHSAAMVERAASGGPLESNSIRLQMSSISAPQ